jgi:hypothetical protein
MTDVIFVFSMAEESFLIAVNIYWEELELNMPFSSDVEIHR